MRIALLKADYVNCDLIARHGDLPSMFSSFLKIAFPQQNVCMDIYEVRHGALPKADAYDLIVITGSRFSANDSDSWRVELSSFIRHLSEAGPPTIGFCFGHQVLAAALGGSVGEAPAGWNVGLWPVRIQTAGDWMVPPHREFQGLFNHREQVLELPPGAVLHAGSDRCPVQIFSYGGRMLGMQFHPEYTVDYQEAIMAVPKNLPVSEVQRAVERNLSTRTDRHVALWMAAFCRATPVAEHVRSASWKGCR